MFAFHSVYFKNLSPKYSDIEYFSSKEVHLLMEITPPAERALISAVWQTPVPEQFPVCQIEGSE